MNALVTGGAGFIGSRLSEKLLDEGHHVAVIDDLSTGRLDNITHLVDRPRFRFANGSITNEMVLDRLVSDCDVIFHLAAVVGVELIIREPVRVIETNVLGTHMVVKLANRYRKKLLIASTSEIYGKSDNVPYSEEDDRLLGPTTKARWSYSTSKAVDEFLGLAYHRQMGLPVVIVRLFNTIGPRQTGRYGMVVPRFIQQAIRGESLTVHGDGQQTRCFCDLEDAVRAIVGLAEFSGAIGDVFNIGSTQEVTILELAQKVLKAVDAAGAGVSPEKRPGAPDGRVVMVPYDQAYEPGFEDMRRRVPDITKINNAIGWEPTVSLDESLRRIVESHLSERGS